MVKRRCALRAPALSILLGVSLLGTEPAAAGDPQAAAWAQVGLRWDPLRSRLRNRPCNSDRDHFEACLLSLAAVAAALDPPRLPLPSGRPEGERFGNARWAIVGETGRSVGANPYSLAARAEREHAVARAWRQQPVGGVDFDAMWSWLEGQIDPDQIPGLCARGVAAYLRRAVDPHTAIAPYHAVDAADHHAPRGTPLHAFRRGREGKMGAVESKLLYERGFRLVWVRLQNLDDVACFDVSAAVVTLLERGATGVILDLRGNLGGVSREAACIADLFLPLGTPIVRIEPLVPDYGARELRAQSDVVVDAPVAVLIDSWSASGAEVIAAALQANRRGLVVGTRSFGKGTYQEATPWPEHPDVVFYRTVARLVIASEFEFQMHGVLPDLAVVPAQATRNSANTAPVSAQSQGDTEVLREENAYVNPIAARYPAIPPQRVDAIERCVAGRPAAAPDQADALGTARQALWCWLSGTLPGA